MAELVSKTIKPTEYYYGKPPTHFANMKTYESIEEKIKLATELKHRLVWETKDDIPYEEKVEIDQRIKDINKAIEFNKQLLNEYKRYMKLQGK
jgi:hypothetical protein